ncbi:MAG: hypothetical protein ABIG28_02855 [archaeon]
MHLPKLKQKKAAIELSVGTIVIIVLAMIMLTMGIVLVTKIMKVGTESVDTLSEKVKGEIDGIFAEEGSKVAIRLGSDKIAKIEQGTNGFGIAVGATTRNKDAVTSDNLKYWLELTNNGDDCSGFDASPGYILDHPFSSRKTNKYNFEDTDGETGYVRLVFNIPDGAGECTQRIKIHTEDTAGEIVSASFRVQIVSGGIFS